MENYKGKKIEKNKKNQNSWSKGRIHSKRNKMEFSQQILTFSHFSCKGCRGTP